MANPLEKSNLADPWWRLNNLYFIKDKAGNVVRFKPNWAQEYFYRNMWYLDIILKARQLGMTTFIQIFMLDRCLFNDNVSAGVVAHNREDAEAFFDDKIKFAYDHLPEDLRRQRKNIADTKNSLHFSNGSKIRVGTSLRSGTYQYVHVSEFGKMCAKFPDKAEEVITGTLNTVAAGQFVFIESTAEGPFGEFYKMCQRAEVMTMAVENGQTEFTPMDYKFFFYPWWRHPDYELDAKVDIPEKLAVYFQELRVEHGIELNDKKKAWYVKKHGEQMEMMKQEYPATPAEAFERSNEVSILGKVLREARKDKRITKLPITRGVPVHTFWDLGRNDSTAIWFMQQVGSWHNFIYYVDGRLEDLTYYADLLHELKQEFKWFYGDHYLPHDVEVTDLSAQFNMSRRRILETAGVSPIRVVPRVKSLNDGIEQMRKKFPECQFDEEGCEKGLEGLMAYEWAYDELNKVTRKTPKPGPANHPSDAFRQFAQGYRGQGGGFRDQQNRFGVAGGSQRKYARQRNERGTLTNPTLDHVR